MDGSTHKIAVAAVSSNGTVCIWEGTVTSFGSPVCSGSNLAVSSASDIQGTLGNGLPWFAFKRSDGHLGRVRRGTSPSNYIFVDLGLPPGHSSIKPSVAAWTSLVDTARVEAAVIGSTGQLFVARVAPSGVAGGVTWVTVPTIPGGQTGSGSRTALAVTPYRANCFMSCQDYVLLYLRSTNDRLYRRRSNTIGDLGSGAWLSSGIGTAAMPPQESWLGNGGAASLPAFFGDTTPVLFGVGGLLAFLAAGTTLQEVHDAGFRDHLRYMGVEVALGSNPLASLWAAESAVGLDSIAAVAGGVRRNHPPPWNVVITQSLSGGDLWTNDLIVPAASSWGGGSLPASLSDPYVFHDRSTSNFHLSVFEAAIQDHNNGTCSLVAPEEMRIIYRRGTFANLNDTTIDGTTVHLVNETGIINPDTMPPIGVGVDHGTMAVSEGNPPTTHMTWFELDPRGDGLSRKLFHWFWDPVNGAGRVEIQSASMVAQAAGVFVDASQTPYAWTGTGHPQICKLAMRGGCIEFGRVGGATLTPPSRSPLITFPSTDPGDEKDQADGCGGNRCVTVEEPFDIVPDPTVAGRIWAAYAGDDPATTGKSSVYVTWHDEACPLDQCWSSAARINTRPIGDERHYVDASLTVTPDATLIVFFSAVESHETTQAEQFVAWSTNAGASWTQHQINESWDPDDLGYHCLRKKFFLGEYRDGAVVGNRAINFVHYSPAGIPSVQRRILSSRWLIYQF